MPSFRIAATTLALAHSMQLTPNANAAPPQPLVVPVMQKDVNDAPGKEMVMLTVEQDLKSDHSDEVIKLTLGPGQPAPVPGAVAVA